MDRTAIEAISALAIAQSALAEANYAVIIPEKYTLQSLEHLQPCPKRFEGTFSTTVLSEFIDYVIKHGNKNTAVYIDNEKMTASAIIDLGSHDEPQWGQHRAMLQLQKTQPYSDLLSLKQLKLTHEQLIELIQDWQDNIVFYNGIDGSEIALDTALKTVRRVKINANSENEHAINHNSASRSTLESIEITAGKNQLPAGFHFTATPYEGMNERDFNCQLRALNDPDGVKFRCRIMQLSAVNESIANEFRDRLKAAIAEKSATIAIHIGTMKYQ